MPAKIIKALFAVVIYGVVPVSLYRVLMWLSGRTPSENHDALAWAAAGVAVYLLAVGILLACRDGLCTGAQRDHEHV